MSLCVIEEFTQQFAELPKKTMNIFISLLILDQNQTFEIIILFSWIGRKSKKISSRYSTFKINNK